MSGLSSAVDAAHRDSSGTPRTPAQVAGQSRPQARLSRKVQRRLLVSGLLVIDWLALALAIACAYAVRFYVPLPVFREVLPRLDYYLAFFAVMIPLWLALFALVGLYAEDNLLGGTREYALVFTACSLGMVLIILLSFFGELLLISRGLLVLVWVFGFLSVAAARFTLRRIVYSLRRRGYFLSPAVIVGAGSEGMALAEQLDAWRASGMQLVGFVDDGLPAGSAVHSGLAVLGGCEALATLVAERGIEQVVVAAAEVPRERVLEIVQAFGMSPHVDIHFSTGLFEILTTGVRVRERAYVPLISLNKVRLTGLDLFMKGALDMAVALPALIVLSPLLAALALWIRLDSPGPAIHRRRVLGLHGREFDAYKFRTMAEGWKRADQGGEVRDQFVNGYKPRHDPRVTRAGRFLRRYSLDELPQLVNVLRRQMSMVGPRMITREERGFYDKWQMNLLTLRPGLSGLWQVSGRAELSYEDKVRLDMYYIRNYSIWLDLQILVRTLAVVLQGHGAY